MTGKIKLSRNLRDPVQPWVAEFAETSEAATIRELFGTTILPMPFTVRAERDRIVAEVEALNPGCVVVVID